MDNTTRKASIKKEKKHLARIREIVSQTRSPFEGMTKEEAIEKMRETREKLWEEKLASRP
ncbi:MAG: hypothetical protein ACUZ8E_02995 [Candidatus Anammoxibacter sp.]